MIIKIILSRDVDMSLNDCITIHKENKVLGFTSNLPRFVLKIWYSYHLYWLKDCILFEDYNNTSFMLFNTNTKEVMIIAVRKDWQGKGLGTALLTRIRSFKDVFVIHEKDTIEFYQKNGFNRRQEINDYQYISFIG